MKYNSKKEVVKVLENESNIQYSCPKNRLIGHFFVQIPKEFARELEIKKGDKMMFSLSLKNKEYKIKLRKTK